MLFAPWFSSSNLVESPTSLSFVYILCDIGGGYDAHINGYKRLSAVMLSPMQFLIRELKLNTLRLYWLLSYDVFCVDNMPILFYTNQNIC